MPVQRGGEKRDAYPVMAGLAAVVACLGAAIQAWRLGLPLQDLALHVGILALGVQVIGFFLYRATFFLGHDDQLRVQRFTDTIVHNGPGLVIVNPVGYRSAEVVKAETLGTMDFVKLQDMVSSTERVAQGPQLLFPGPYEKVTDRGFGISLGCAEHVIVEDQLTGRKNTVKGPCVWFPGPHDKAHKGTDISLQKTEYIFVENKLTGEKTAVKGPRVWCPEPYDSASPKQTALALQDDEYIRLKDAASGQRWVQKGRALVFLEPTWRIEGAGPKDAGVKKAWVLKSHEYLKLLDVSTGKVLVHRGETMVFPGPDEELVGSGIKQAIEVDGEHAALVRDKSTGQLRLVTEYGLFVPGPNESVEEVRELIKLAEHEALITKDRDGTFHYHYGSASKRLADQPRSFFLPPYSEIVKIWWSRGPRRERKDISFERFDCRPHFMKFEFNCRTSDNVELMLEGVIFWELVDLPSMFRHTGDTSGDIVYHLRSQFISRVARVTLKAFMEELHDISRNVQEEDAEFYSTRGIKVYSLEVTRYQCTDAKTAEILSQTIQETTSRMNRLSQAESENEVNLFQKQGQVEQARLNSSLLEIEQEQQQSAAHIAGVSEARQVAAFLQGFEKDVPSLEDRVGMWRVLRKTDALSVVSGSGANLYFTPNDVDLSIEARAQPAVGVRA